MPTAKTTPKICSVCGIAFYGTAAQSACGATCAHHLSQTTRAARARDRNQRVCSHCGVAFCAEPDSKGLYCSRECHRAHAKAHPRYSSYRERRRQERIRYVERRGTRCTSCSTPFLGEGECSTCRRRLPEPFSSQCVGCGQQLTGRRRKYCTVQCGKETNRRIRRSLHRVAGRAGERIDPIAVFERDRWRCHLCGKKTLKTKRGSVHSLAPEMDHIVPLSKGGLHVLSNVACSCRACNNWKRARLLGQLLLLG